MRLGVAVTISTNAVRCLARVSMSTTPRNQPVVFVIGCTGTGKSDLGVAIAQKYGGEVISADSMQLYKGLDIATNKITEEEAAGIPHHLMSFLDPSNDAYHVHQFRQQGLALIQEIRSRGRMPVVVGGTAYYVESLLFADNFIETPTTSSQHCVDDDVDVLSNDELWKLLQQADPESASLVHPNNRTRVRRAIEIFRISGKRKSEHIRGQKDAEDVDLGGRLRFDDSLVVQRLESLFSILPVEVVFLDASAEVLDERLDQRVEKMQALGLEKELREFYRLNQDVLLNGNPYGVMQCIGLKEFIPWLQLSDDERESKKGLKLFRKGCEGVKLHTRQYSRKQRRWFLSRMLRRRGNERVASTMMVDTSDKSKIIEKGMRVVDEWMAGADFEVPEEFQTAGEKGVDANTILKCDVCDKLVSGRQNWRRSLVRISLLIQMDPMGNRLENHVNGKPHKSVLKRQNEQEEAATND